MCVFLSWTLVSEESGLSSVSGRGGFHLPGEAQRRSWQPIGRGQPVFPRPPAAPLPTPCLSGISELVGLLLEG